MIDNRIEPPDDETNQHPKAIQVEIHQLSHLSKIVRALGTGGWIFRGHASSEWPLSSSLEREFIACPQKNKQNQQSTDPEFGMSDECYAIELFKRLSQGKIVPQVHAVEWLAAMQHYGTHTRLVDFTRSIYVALYFAFEDRQATTTRAIYAIRFKDLIHNNTIRNDLINVLVEGLDKKGISKGADYERRMKFIKKSYYKNQLELQQTLARLADDVILGRSKGDGVIPVHVPGANDRLVAQSGLFLLPRSFNSFESNLALSLGLGAQEIRNPRDVVSDPLKSGVTTRLRAASFVKLVFDRNRLPEHAIWSMLDQANVSAQSLFPGLEGIAKSIRYGEPLFAM